MTKLGSRVVEGAREALAHAKGQDVPGLVEHVPETSPSKLDPDLIQFITNLAIADARRDHLIATGVLQPDGRPKVKPDAAPRHRPRSRP